MRRIMAILFGLLLVQMTPLKCTASQGEERESEMATVVRQLLSQTNDPAQVARFLRDNGARFIGFQEAKATFVRTSDGVIVVYPTHNSKAGGDTPEASTEPLAGDKTDLTLTLWLYEWSDGVGSYTEQAVISGAWSSTEYSWIDDPVDVIDVRWTVGDLVYHSSLPYDGVRRDQHTNGIASFTVDDQIESWDLFVNFKPTSSSAYERWTNIFANYTHTWWGVKLTVTLSAAPQGGTGTISINTDGKTWTEGMGLAFQIGSQETRGPVSTSSTRRWESAVEGFYLGVTKG